MGWGSPVLQQPLMGAVPPAVRKEAKATALWGSGCPQPWNYTGTVWVDQSEYWGWWSVGGHSTALMWR